MISIDSFFKMGKDHKKCEDYIIHGNDPFPYVILSDGCSSCLHTDVGARILAHQLKKNLKNISINFYPYIELVLYESRELAKSLFLHEECLNCTLLCIFIQEETVYSFIIGDGAVIFKEKEKEVDFLHHSFSNNTPFYISYFNKELETKKTLKIETNNMIQHESFNNFYIKKWPINNLEYILLVSDGLESFNNGFTDIKFIELVKDLTDFKNVNGSFIERKVKRILKNYEKEGFYPSDDISVGGIHLGA